MSFRARLFAAFLAAVLLPIGVLAYGVRREMTARLTGEYERRVASLVSVIRDDLGAESLDVATRLATVASDLAADNQFRLAARSSESGDRRWLLDYAGNAMRVAGLDMLEIQDSAGRVLSSGHFRNAYGRLQPRLSRGLAQTPNGIALVRTRTAEDALLVLARVDSFQVAGRRYFVVGGTVVDSAALGRLAPDLDLTVALTAPSDTVSSPGFRGAVEPSDAGTLGGAVDHRLVSELSLPYLDALADSAAGPDSARFVVAQRLTTLRTLRRSVDLWFLAALGATAVLAVALAGVLASRVSRPLSELARKTAAIHLDRLDQDFASDRTDEIGALSRLLGAMTDRLRAGAARLREAERRATVGDVARQVNHDIKNGLAPIRHVLRHLDETARTEPGQLAVVFAERQGTLDSSVAYLETLAQNYARLSPKLDREPCDVNAVVRQVAGNAARGQTRLELRLGDRLPSVRADALVLRRILENLVGNAVDSLESRAGGVAVSTAASDGVHPAVRVTVSDTGRGMTRDELDRAFDDFYTTKPGGTGLGLSVVRRLVADLSGTLRVETEPGAGTRVIIDLPVVS